MNLHALNVNMTFLTVSLGSYVCLFVCFFALLQGFCDDWILHVHLHLGHVADAFVQSDLQ